MPVVTIPNNETWKVARFEFNALMSRVQRELVDADDVYTITQAVALDGLHFGLIDREQAVRIAPVIARVADELRWEIEGNPRDVREAEFAQALAELEMLLHDVYE